MLRFILQPKRRANRSIGIDPQLIETTKKALESVPGWAITTFIGAAVGYFVRVIRERLLTTKPIRAMLQLTKPAQAKFVVGVPWGILPQTATLHPSEGLPIFGFGPLMAFHRLSSTFSKVYPHVQEPDLLTSRSFDLQDLDCDLFLFGSPRFNPITKLILEAGNLPFEWEERRLIDSLTSTIIAEPSYEGGSVKRDFGIIVQMSNPMAPGRTVTILAGLETFGVKAATEFLVDPKNLRILRGVPRWKAFLITWLGNRCPRRWLSEYSVVVVKTHVAGLFTSPPNVVFTRQGSSVSGNRRSDNSNKKLTQSGPPVDLDGAVPVQVESPEELRQSAGQ